MPHHPGNRSVDGGASPPLYWGNLGGRSVAARRRTSQSARRRPQKRLTGPGAMTQTYALLALVHAVLETGYDAERSRRRTAPPTAGQIRSSDRQEPRRVHGRSVLGAQASAGQALQPAELTGGCPHSAPEHPLRPWASQLGLKSWCSGCQFVQRVEMALGWCRSRARIDMFAQWSCRIAAYSSTFDICGMNSTFHQEHPDAALARTPVLSKLVNISRTWIAVPPRPVYNRCHDP